MSLWLKDWPVVILMKTLLASMIIMCREMRALNRHSNYKERMKKEPILGSLSLFFMSTSLVLYLLFFYFFILDDYQFYYTIFFTIGVSLLLWREHVRPNESNHNDDDLPC